MCSSGFTCSKRAAAPSMLGVEMRTWPPGFRMRATVRSVASGSGTCSITSPMETTSKRVGRIGSRLQDARAHVEPAAPRGTSAPPPR